MIYKADISDINFRKILKPMFDNVDSTIILSYLQGHMGTAWVDDLKNPTVAQIRVGIFVFFAGNPNTKEADELLHNLNDYNLAIASTNEWKERIETVHRGFADKFQRYQFEKNPEFLDEKKLENFIALLPEEYNLKRIDANIAKESTLHELSEYFISQFKSIDDFIDRGIGFAITKKDEVISAATSYSIYDGGIEIEIATNPQHRGKGLATITASALIVDCLKKGLYPSWDADNNESLNLAQKLGYVYKESYDTYFVKYAMKKE